MTTSFAFLSSTAAATARASSSAFSFATAGRTAAFGARDVFFFRVAAGRFARFGPVFFRVVVFFFFVGRAIEARLIARYCFAAKGSVPSAHPWIHWLSE